MMRAIATSLVLAAACAGADDAANDTPPTLEITSPARGTLAEGGRVTVTGRATDNGAVRVTVNGVEAQVGSDGAFSAELDVAPGLALLETHAIDGSGNDVRDVRAVLAGTLTPTDGSSPAPIAAAVGPAGLLSIGNALGTAASGIDFTAAATAMNPVYDNGGCLGATVNITSVSVGNIDVDLAPTAGAIDTNVVLSDVTVRLRASFKVACIGGSTNITVRTTAARIRDDLGVALAGGAIRTALPSPTVQLDGFSVDVGGVPGAIESLLKDEARKGAEKALVNAIKTRVPPMADQQLAALIGRPLDTALLGHAVSIRVAPSKVEISNAGLFVATDTSFAIEGGEGGMFAATPMPAAAPDSANLSLLVADDAANQLFAGLWAAGVFQLDASIDDFGPVAALLDDDVRTLSVQLSLPPAVDAGGAFELAIGDLIITGKDAGGAEVQKFAMSLRTTLAASANGSGGVTLATTTPTVYAQVLAQSDAVEDPLDDARIEGIVTGVWGLVDQQINDALGTLPMPAMAGMTVDAPAVSGRDGYVIVDAALR